MFNEFEQNFKINLNYNYCNNYNTFLGKNITTLEQICFVFTIHDIIVI